MESVVSIFIVVKPDKYEDFGATWKIAVENKNIQNLKLLVLLIFLSMNYAYL